MVDWERVANKLEQGEQLRANTELIIPRAM